MKIRLLNLILITFITILFIYNCQDPIDEQQQQFQQYINEENWQAVEKFVIDYMNSDKFIAHTAGFNILPELIQSKQLWDLSENLVRKCIYLDITDFLIVYI